MHVKVLGIETSCDETSAAVVEDGTRVLSCVIASSRETFAKLGGVIPEEAAREQIRCVLPVIDQALTEASITRNDLEAIAVTRGPGLTGSLLVGTTTARTLASVLRLPLIGVHHTLGHLSSPWLDCDGDPQFPVLTLSASGGHTELWLRASHTENRLLGRTRDDAAGEAFDKGAQLLGLPYPGGPSVERAAQSGDPAAFPFPHPLAGSDGLDFSFSGLKTSLRYLLRDTPEAARRTADVAASYQHAILRHLVSRLERALRAHPEVREIHTAGGVSANRALQDMIKPLATTVTVRSPKTLRYCTDNAAMIAAAGCFLIAALGESATLPFSTDASLPLENV